LQYISRLHETLDGHYKTQSTLFSPDETLDLHLIICGDAAAPYMCINYLYCTTLCDSSFHMMFISFSSCSMLKPHVTFCKKKTYCNIYYCLSRTNIIAQLLLILLPSSENASSIWRICLLESTKMHLIIDIFAYWKVMKCFL